MIYKAFTPHTSQLNLPNSQTPEPVLGCFYLEKNTMPKDIVYILKDKLDTDELRYSLRSVETNFPHRFVWFVGGQPEGFKPDRALPHKQGGANKWELIRSSMLRVIQEPDLTDEFYLFNDDFFVMTPQRGEFVNFTDRTLDWRIADLRKEYPFLNNYGRTLQKAEAELKIKGSPTDNYEVHLPMLFEKAKVSVVLQCSSPQMRSIYGNINRVEHIQHADVKVYDLDEVPESPDYLSTNDKTFTDGKVGEYIRRTFPNPSRFEVTT